MHCRQTALLHFLHARTETDAMYVELDLLSVAHHAVGRLIHSAAAAGTVAPLASFASAVPLPLRWIMGGRRVPRASLRLSAAPP